jgi:hypothetical protein
LGDLERKGSAFGAGIRGFCVISLPTPLQPNRRCSRINFTQAGLTEAAIEWWRTAGQRSLARSALLEGAEQLKRALDQIATLPTTPDLRGEEIKLEVAFANALSLTGNPVSGKEHYDRAVAIYDPAEHGSLTTRSGRDVRVALLSSRAGCMLLLGHPAASRNDAQHALQTAREIGQAFFRRRPPENIPTPRAAGIRKLSQKRTHAPQQRSS